jgi:ubiquinone/menaquinone biosynthesis C-methylase UbiE
LNIDNTKTNYHAKSGYRGKTAQDYDRKRRKRKKWRLELDAVETMITHFDAGSSILDLPLGTGRFLPLYKPGNHRVLGLDISLDMLQQARDKLQENVRQPAMAMGDGENIPLKDLSVDYVVCIRLLNWLTHEAMKKVIAECDRVARKGMVIGFRTRKPMTAADFIKMGLIELMPTPRHLKKWGIALHRFTMKVKGKLLKIARQTVKKEKPQTDTPLFSGSNIYDRQAMLKLFSHMQMEVIAEIPIDRTASFGKRTVNPYSIFYLAFNKS